MALPDRILRFAPRQSWWCQPDRESFRRAELAERDRMRQIAAFTVGTIANESQHQNRMSQPNRHRGAE